MKSWPMPDGAILRAWRQQRGLLQRDVAGMLRVETRTVTKIERGRGRVPEYRFPQLPAELQRRLLRGRIRTLREMLKEARHG